MKWRYLFLLILTVSQQLSAEEPSQLLGLSPEEVERRYGPSSVKEGNELRRTWKYGETVIFFENDKVIGGIGGKELDELAVKQSVTKKTEDSSDPFGKDWQNAWKVKKRANAEDVVEELLK